MNMLLLGKDPRTYPKTAISSVPLRNMIEGALNRNLPFKEESCLAKIMCRIMSFQLALILFQPVCIFKHHITPFQATLGVGYSWGPVPEMSPWHSVTVLHSCPQTDF